MNEAHNYVKAKFSSRVFSALFNFFIFACLTIFFDRFVMTYTYKQWVNFEAIKTEFSQKYEEYNKLQDKYHLYYYDDNKNRKVNKDVTKEELDAFYKDENVIRLEKELPPLENKCLAIEISSIAIAYIITTFGLMILMSYAFGRGHSIGGFLFKIRYVNEDYSIVSKKKVFQYDLLSFVFHYLLAPLTLFIVPCVLLYQIYYDEKNQSSIEKWLKIIFVSKT